MDTLDTGSIAWVDLTIPDASALTDFYKHVVGWEPASVPMGDYQDYAMNLPGTQTPAAGICHARGSNAAIPPQWLIYITVANLESSIMQCKAHGGSIIVSPRGSGKGRYCVIKDPAGAVCALYEPPTS
jgi:predicted enzyme related to lactoylglutathione lyase